MDTGKKYQTKLFFTTEALFGDARKRLRTRRFLLTASFSLIILVMLPIPSLAQSALTDDAHVSLFHGAANHGANPNLNVSPMENTYLRFDLSSTLPLATPGSEVGRATLKLYVGSVKVAGKLDVYPVLGPWDESVITRANVPPLGSLVATTDQIGADQKGKFIAIDVTPLVRQWLGDDGQGTNGIPNHGLALVAHPADATSPEVADITFDSKENPQTSHEAQLNIQLESMASGLQRVEHDATLTGGGTTASPLGVASGGVNTEHLANDAVTGEKIALNAVTSSELADGAVTSPKIKAPLSFTSADPGFTLSIANTGAGAAITAAGAIDTSIQYNIGGQRILSNPGVDNLFAGTDAGASNTIGVANAFFGSSAGASNTTGASNSFVGNNAGAGNTTGGHNSFFGDAAGFRNAAGNDNSFFGFLAGFHNTAHNNSYFGSLAGADNTTGFQNSFFGSSAGVHNTTGSANAFFGFSAGASNTTGGANSFFGREAGLSNTTGSGNAFFGTSAGVFTTTGGANSFFGSNAGNNNTTGGGNSFFGQSAGQNNTTGSNNVFLGRTAGLGNTTGGSLTLIGANANVGANNLTFATAIGAEAVVSASNTVVLGRSADTVRVPGALNVAGGFAANVLEATTQYNIGGLRILATSGPYADPELNLQASNTFVGEGSGLNTTPNPAPASADGKVNTFVGAGAGRANTTGSLNSFFGVRAGRSNTTGGANVMVGYGAGELNTTGVENVLIGNLAGQFNATGSSNTFVGNLAGLTNTTGGANAFFGVSAGFSNKTGQGNAFIGPASGGNNLHGSFNTYLGNGAGSQSFEARYCTMVGGGANFAEISNSNLYFATAIGAFAKVNASDTIVIGKAAGTYDDMARPADTVQIPGALSVGGALGANTVKANGKIYVEANGQGVILKSPSGACFELTVTDAGALTTTAIACP
jgi:hypothetical protein